MKDVDSISFINKWAKWINELDSENIFETLHQ